MVNPQYINVILPLAVPRIYTYEVPPGLQGQVAFGMRVEVPLRSKLYSAIVVEIDVKPDPKHKPRKIVSLIDASAIITREQYLFWQWLSSYYMTTIGEVMNVAMPAGLKLSSESKIIAMPGLMDKAGEMTDHEFLIAEAISIREELTIQEIQDILDKKTVFPVIKNLLEKGAILIKEELKTKYKPKIEDFMVLSDGYNRKDLSEAFEKIKRSEQQTHAFLSYISLSKDNPVVAKKDVLEMSGMKSPVIKALEKRGLVKIIRKEVSRFGGQIIQTSVPPPLSMAQQEALESIHAQFEDKDILLLFGVTGSGKTRLYMELIRETLTKGQQVLYLLPEIALTTQITARLQSVFGDNIGIYHSRMNNNERVELWNATLNNKPILLGARSSLLLPFRSLGLIIVDEEHDPSYKQNDPAPRYNARDAAIFLASMNGAKVILGTATPSLETYQNTIDNKYGLVKILERHGESVLPELSVIDLKEQYSKNLMSSLFSKPLVDLIQTALENKEQSLIFQNRRGYAPTLQCVTCDWHAGCPNCDVGLTVHRYFEELRCHYCGYRGPIPRDCPQCGFDQLKKIGFGTQKIEDEIKNIFPEARVRRMDYDTTKSKNAYEKILNDFREQKIDILVGTQMITKGLDFHNISVVGILLADKMLYFPDFRAHERAFQLITQVSGRAGRRARQGKVAIQTFNPDHPVILETLTYNYSRFYKRELRERKRFYYPPFYRLINITLRHKKVQVVEDTAEILAQKLKTQLHNRVIGPSLPGIARVRGFYIRLIHIKFEKDARTMRRVKEIIRDSISSVRQLEGKKSTRITIDVDP